VRAFVTLCAVNPLSSGVMCNQSRFDAVAIAGLWRRVLIFAAAGHRALGESTTARLQLVNQPPLEGGWLSKAERLRSNQNNQ
jgi:hypothetical protein